MLKSSVRPVIRLKGVRHNNLKNFDLDLPLHRLIVITGLSGSGKSSLAFDTLFAEGQRRYIETFSPYARQFLDRMDKPQVDSIEGIPPAIAIEQRNGVKTTRSTVGTMTEICEHMKLLWPHVSKLHCRKCGQIVRKDSPQLIWTQLLQGAEIAGQEALITFTLPASEKLTDEETLGLVAKQGYQRVLLEGKVLRLDEVAAALKSSRGSLRALTIVQDRIKITDKLRARFVEACEQAYHFGKGLLAIYPIASPPSEKSSSLAKPLRFSNRLHCAPCGIDYREPSPALFSFNHPVGACPTCRGFGRVISIDYGVAIPDRSKTLNEGVVKPWMSGHGRDSHFDLMRVCKQFGIPTNVPFFKLSAEWQRFVIEGDPEHGEEEENQWPHKWYGVKGYFRWLESKAYKMHVRVMLSRYRAYTPCPACEGKRFQPDTLLHLLEAKDSRYSHLSLADFYLLPVREAARVVTELSAERPVSTRDPLSMVIEEVRSRLRYLEEVGLSYLTLDRPTKTLSGGETERVNLTTCLGTRLVNTLFVLDEPSVGLHPRDTDRLVKILKQLKDCGNTVVVVEHEPNVMMAADQIIDIGPGHGATGGEVVFQGPVRDILKSNNSLTGAYLSGRKRIELPSRRPVNLERAPGNRFSPEALSEALASSPLTAATTPALRIRGASCHNLKEISVDIPLGRFVCLTGVSGSGKTTLLRDVLLPGLSSYFRPIEKEADEAEIENGEKENGSPEAGDLKCAPTGRLTVDEAGQLKEVVLVDQSTLGKTPRSNPAVYIGAFEDIREFFAQSEMAMQRGLGSSAFSFNSSQGQCQRCRGAGFEKIEMQFLSDIFIRCGECKGRRYRPHILDIKVRPAAAADRLKALQHLGGSAEAGWSIADVLDATVDETIDFLLGFPDSRPARRATESIRLLQEVGLGYLKVGQPINTLSGGESQRLKLVRHLATVSLSPQPALASAETVPVSKPQSARSRVAKLLCRPGMEKVFIATPGEKKTLFLFDEPTTGLHFDDVRILLKVFQRLVDAGHSVVVIEHNLELIKNADWIIDLGPEAGDEGGQLVAQGTPEEVADCRESHTGTALRPLVFPGRKARRNGYRASRDVSAAEERLILKE